MGELTCPHCEIGYSQEDIGKYEMVPIETVKSVLDRFGLGEIEISKAYRITCECGKKFIIAEVSEMGEDVYLTLSLAGDGD